MGRGHRPDGANVTQEASPALPLPESPLSPDEEDSSVVINVDGETSDAATEATADTTDDGADVDDAEPDDRQC